MTTQTHPTIATVLSFAADLVEGLDLVGGVTVDPATPHGDVVLPPQISVYCPGGLDEVVGVADRIGGTISTSDHERSGGVYRHHVTEGEWAGVAVRAFWIEKLAAVTA